MLSLEALFYDFMVPEMHTAPALRPLGPGFLLPLGVFPTTSTTSAQLPPLHFNEQKWLFLRRQQRLVSELLKEPVSTAARAQRDLLVLGQLDKQPVLQPTLGDKQLFLW